VIRAGLASMLVGALALSCSPEPADASRPMTIRDVIANIDALNGQPVRVAGYIGECRGYECQLFENEAGKVQWDRYIADIRADAAAGRQLSPGVAEPPTLGIGAGENRTFDRAAEPYANSYVVITGRVSNRCRFNGQPDCTGRGTDLEPTHIGSWRRSDGSAEKGNSL
jgi:hypothetical protein